MIDAAGSGRTSLTRRPRNSIGRDVRHRQPPGAKGEMGVVRTHEEEQVRERGEQHIELNAIRVAETLGFQPFQQTLESRVLAAQRLQLGPKVGAGHFHRRRQ
jgi:hypothetical protein